MFSLSDPVIVEEMITYLLTQRPPPEAGEIALNTHYNLQYFSGKILPNTKYPKIQPQLASKEVITRLLTFLDFNEVPDTVSLTNIKKVTQSIIIHSCYPVCSLFYTPAYNSTI